MEELTAILSLAYKKCMDEWVKRRHMCIASGGCYFEGDKINLPKNEAKLILLKITGIFFFTVAYKVICKMKINKILVF